MADEMRLPEELAAFEALLAARTLPTSRLDRDQLMYRAGWAACEANFQPRALPGGRHALSEEVAAAKGYPRAEPGAISGRHTAAWSCASAALAASIAVAMTLGWSSIKPSEVAEAERGGGETPRLAVDESAASTSADDERTAYSTAPSLLNNLNRFIDADAYSQRPTLAGPWLAMQRLDLRQVDARDDHIANDVDATPATPKTIRNLQHELLPNAIAPTRFVWPWERTTSGDSI